MSIDAMDLDIDISDWLKGEEGISFKREIEERILKVLFSFDPDSISFRKMVAQLACIGSSERDRALLGRDIVQLDLFQEVFHCGLRKEAKKAAQFIKDHKIEILVGLALLATGVAIAAATGFTLSGVVYGAGGGVVIAGANSIFESKDEKPNPRIPKHNILLPKSSVDVSRSKVDLPPSPDQLYVTDEGMWFGGQFFSKQDALQYSHLASYYDGSLPAYSPSINGIGPIVSNPAYTGIYSPNLQLNDLLTKLNEPKELEHTEPVPQGSRWIDRVLRPMEDPLAKNHLTGTSHLFSIPGRQSSRCRIGWINGIRNSYSESFDSGKYIQDLSNGHAICGIYNFSHNGLADAAEVFLLNYAGISPVTANLLQKEWTDFHKANWDNPNAKFLQVCHSQGAIHVKNALENSPKEIRDRVIVVSIAGAAVVPKSVCFKSYNYASENDIVYKFEPNLLPLEQGVIDDVMVPRFGEPSKTHLDELIILPAHENASYFDHEFQSPTFEQPIRDVLEDYYKHGGEYLPEEQGK